MLFVHEKQHFPCSNDKLVDIKTCFVKGLHEGNFQLCLNPILDGVRAYPILDGGQKSPPGLTLPFSV